MSLMCLVLYMKMYSLYFINIFEVEGVKCNFVTRHHKINTF